MLLRVAMSSRSSADVPEVKVFDPSGIEIPMPPGTFTFFEHPGFPITTSGPHKVLIRETSGG